MRSKQSIKEGRSLPAHQTQLFLSPQLNLLPLCIMQALTLLLVAAVALTALVVVQAMPEPFPDPDWEAFPDPDYKTFADPDPWKGHRIMRSASAKSLGWSRNTGRTGWSGQKLGWRRDG
ncbi:hypothetical protein GWK47_019730 [Chionoecetes opilio]|uniref:Uncharacterized protein n=1 Tax=Chionoecetes opilio TaxID=41210 RepID=A0A8J5CFN0_CHIOP|nr:hypothetical protein GWK47_019728 [Chionoecetes opilio]KAG0711841.1 hypothetical protein GWK47_019730 [Chionoecetes opilio]